MKKKVKAANVGVSLYDGQLEVHFDCVGATRCVHARFFVEPPDPGDDCAFSKYGGSCTHGPAQKAALEHLREVLSEKEN